ncbi:MAG: trypsin-like peptidase domain-containing protein [Planctomycetaceae bacterium]|nr:trypsin-like peptidase domain-containing protein [Planctomycetaceae bacterium]
MKLMRVIAVISAALAFLALPAAVMAQAASKPAPKQTVQDFREIIRRATDKVFPAVVFIKVLSETHESGRKVTQEAFGSGVIISDKGEVLTNWHVIDKAVEVRAMLYDGRGVDAKVIGSDKDTDLALVQLQLPPTDKASALPWAQFGDSDALKEGDFVMAMGAPYGLSRSVSQGIISCTRRYLRGNSEYSLWLQTDAAINPGNSGGPLVDTEGRVVGINARGASGSDGLGFAIPTSTVKLIVAQLRQFKKVNWSWTGLQLQPLKDFNRNIYFEGDSGVIAADPDPESPAQRAGIKARDRILKVNGAALTAMREEDLPAVNKVLGLLAKGKPATFDILREGKAMSIVLTPREKGKVEGEELALPRWDMTIKTINQFENEDLYFYCKEGIFVYGIKWPGNAGSAGLERQDIILKVEGADVKTLDDLKKIHAEMIKNVAVKHRALFTIMRNGLTRQIVVDFSRDYEKE